MRKEDLKKIKGLLYGIGLGVLPITLSGCDYTSTEIKYILTHNNYDPEDIGYLKNGEESVPYFDNDGYNLTIRNGLYNYNTAEYIGNWTENGIQTKDKILYAEEQVISFFECNPYVEYNYETVSSFTEETYQNLDASYFANHSFSSSNLKIYEILNVTTNEINYVIGRKVSGTQVFNFETYVLEDYTGHAIKDMEVTHEKEGYYYSEILELIKNYRKQNQSLSLERK